MRVLEYSGLALSEVARAVGAVDTAIEWIGKMRQQGPEAGAVQLLDIAERLSQLSVTLREFTIDIANADLAIRSKAAEVTELLAPVAEAAQLG